VNISAARLATFSLLAALLVAAGPARADKTAEFDQRVTLARGETIRAETVNGSIVATRGGSQARVHARITSADEDPATVKIHVFHRGTTLFVCPVLPGQTVSDDCRTQGDHTGSRMRIDLTLEIPAGVDLTANTVNGRISANIDGNVDAHNVNQAIVIVTRGFAQAETVNGSVDVTLGAAAWTGTLKFAAVNGSVSVRVPRKANFEVRAASVNGRIKVDGFPLSETAGQFVGHSLDGTVGSGGRTLRLQTVNGPIALSAG
jgi:hypothetical protein